MVGSSITTAGVRGWSDNAIGQKYSDQLFSMNSYSAYAVAAKLLYNAQYKDKMLTDSSIFDFYNNLIDGDNKREWARWTVYNVSFSQTGWNDRVGLELAYFNQSYKSGGWSLLGGTPAINIDITKEIRMERRIHITALRM
jgi:hypothetical protein